VCLHEFADWVTLQASYQHNRAALPRNMPTNCGSRVTDHPRRVARVVRGAVVGGSGTVNGGYFCRGLPRDFDGWELPGWSWDAVLAHFRAIENDHDFGGPEHGCDGPIPVERISELSQATNDFVDHARRIGYRWLPDLNSVDAEVGVGPVPLNIASGARAGPGTAVLHPALSRPNLTLRPHTSAVWLTLDGRRVTGVEAVDAGGSLQLSADRVVLCAGAIESARLLMLSGIGDRAVLRRAGIAIVTESPVGMHCADHPEWVIPTSWTTTPGRPVLEAVLNTDFDVEIRPYTGGFVAMVGDGTAGHPDWPHIGVGLMQPRARGTVTVLTADPAEPPVIEHRYDSEPADVAALKREPSWLMSCPESQAAWPSRCGRRRSTCARRRRWARMTTSVPSLTRSAVYADWTEYGLSTGRHCPRSPAGARMPVSSCSPTAPPSSSRRVDRRSAEVSHRTARSCCPSRPGATARSPRPPPR
jgi:predicted dehydrogenase (TIGR03970 family)